MTDAFSSNAHAGDGAPAAPQPPPRRPPLVPPHIAWPAFVVFLLLLSVAAAVGTVIAANSDGGVQVIEGSPYDTGR